jgi:hypothetical protein
MNHIHRLTQERDEAQEALRQTNEALTELLAYLSSSKFHGVDNDVVHVSTDIAPKLRDIRTLTLQEVK